MAKNRFKKKSKGKGLNKRYEKPFELPNDWIQQVPSEKRCSNSGCNQEGLLIYSKTKGCFVRSKYCYYCQKQKRGLLEPIMTKNFFLGR